MRKYWAESYRGCFGIDKEYRKDGAIVAAWVLHYWEKKRECEEAFEQYLEEISTHASKPELVPIHGSLPGDRTGNQATKLADTSRRLEREAEWLELVEEVESKLPPKMQIFLRLRREAEYTKTRLRGRPGWVAYVQDHYAKEMAKANNKRPSDYWVEDRTFFAWWDRIVTYAVIRAAKRGILG